MVGEQREERRNTTYLAASLLDFHIPLKTNSASSPHLPPLSPKATMVATRALSAYPTLPYSPDKSLRIVVTGAGGFIASHLARRLFNQKNNTGVAPHTIVCCDWKRNEHMKVRGRLERCGAVGAEARGGGRGGVMMGTGRPAAVGVGTAPRAAHLPPASASPAAPLPAPAFTPQCVTGLVRMPSRGRDRWLGVSTCPWWANANIGSKHGRPRASAGRRHQTAPAMGRPGRVSTPADPAADPIVDEDIDRMLPGVR